MSTTFTCRGKAIASPRRKSAKKRFKVGRGDEETLEAKAVFPFLGLIANSALLPDAVARDEGGRVLVDDNLMTTLPDVYAVGALRAGYAGQLTNAVSDASTVAQKL